MATVSAVAGLGCAPMLDLDSFRYQGEDEGTSTRTGRCVRGWPLPPRVNTDPLGQRFTFAMRQVEFGETFDEDGIPGYQKIGFNLDCAGPGGPSSCIRPDHPTWPDGGDGVGGIDNTTGRIGWEFFHHYGGSSDDAIVNENTELGFIGTVFVIDKYNGLTDDEDVDVAVLAASVFPDPMRYWKNKLSNEEIAPYKAKWHGSDEWRALPESLEEGPDPAQPFSIDRPKYRDTSAYVSNGTLVVRLSSWLSAFAPMSQVVFTARIENHDGAYSLEDGVADGRIHKDHLLASVETKPDPVNPEKPFCTDSEYYPHAKDWLCGTADINYASDDDGSAPCDAVTQAWRFRAEPAKLVGVAAIHDYLASRCPEGNRPRDEICP